MLTGGDRLEVWGDPIAHSLSPRLHTAAYDALGLDWSYDRRQVDVASFAGELASLGTDFRGLSVTMPLKSEAYAASSTRNRHAELSGAVNTLLLTAAGPHGFNTDVAGIAADVAEQLPGPLTSARIVGSGATATSALLALQVLGARDVEITARRPEAVAHLVDLGAQIGLTVRGVGLDASGRGEVPLTIATLPGGAVLDAAVADELAARGGLLYDVVYGQWPTALARAWHRRGAPAISGIGMLVQQALRQVRVFVTGHDEEALPDEAVVLDAMRAAVTQD